MPENLIAPGDKLCCECWISIHKQFKVSNTDDNGSTSSYDDIAMRDTSDDHNMDVEVGGEREHSLFDINSTLPIVGETPVKTGGLSATSRRRKGKKKLKSATKTLKRKLEASYEVSLDTSDSNNEDNGKNDLKLYEGMMNKLAEKYKNSESYQECIQILTLSPFTIERSMKEFGATNYMVKKS